MNALYSVCPYCQKQNPITILADIVKYYCKNCSKAYMVKRETIFVTITPGLVDKKEGDVIETISADN